MESSEQKEEKTLVTPITEANKIKQEYVDLRQKQRLECDKEISAVLKKYGFDLGAEVIVGERGVVPSVVLKDML